MLSDALTNLNIFKTLSSYQQTERCMRVQQKYWEDNSPIPNNWGTSLRRLRPWFSVHTKPCMLAFHQANTISGSRLASHKLSTENNDVSNLRPCCPMERLAPEVFGNKYGRVMNTGWAKNYQTSHKKNHPIKMKILECLHCSPSPYFLSWLFILRHLHLSKNSFCGGRHLGQCLISALWN